MPLSMLMRRGTHAPAVPLAASMPREPHAGERARPHPEGKGKRQRADDADRRGAGPSADSDSYGVQVLMCLPYSSQIERMADILHQETLPVLRF